MIYQDTLCEGKIAIFATILKICHLNQFAIAGQYAHGYLRRDNFQLNFNEVMCDEYSSSFYFSLKANLERTKNEHEETVEKERKKFSVDTKVGVYFVSVHLF